MLMRMMYDEKLAQAAYLIGCQRSRQAIVFDPLRDVDRAVDLAAAHGLKIVAVAETHIHADFVSGARELAERNGAHVYVSGEGGPDWQSRWLNARPSGGAYEHTILRDGDAFTLGGIEFTALHTPGHTPEHIVYLVTDRGGGADEPVGLISGDFLFVGDLGRPDLLETAAGQAGAMEPSARTLYRTLARLDAIPDHVQVWPGHGAGSACGKALGAVPTSTIGYERRFNAALRAASSESDFVSFILEGQPEPPMYFATMKRVNRDGPRVLGSLPTPERLGPDRIAAMDPRATAIIDTRSWGEFRKGHLPASLSFPLVNSFSTDAGSMIRVDEPIVLIIEPELLDGAIRDLVRIGLDRIIAWCPAPEIAASSYASATIAQATVDRVKQGVGADEAVLDVRRRTEFVEGRIPGATNISHTRLMGRLDEVPRGRRLLINCRSGFRSARAAAFLQRAGYPVVNIEGGFLAWQGADAPIER
jgi:hydroxyacylglutathione hydrolase